jgi:hypothetical protein
MARELRRESDRETLEFLREERELAIDCLDRISAGWTFHEAEGAAPMRNVTSEREVHLRAQLDRLDKLIDALENRHA